MSLVLSDSVAAQLQGAKLRATLRRVQILQLFVSKPRWQASIEQIYAELMTQRITVSYSDIYRVVRSLESGGLLSKGWVPGKSVPLSVYALKCEQTPPHQLHRFMCKSCGRTQEFHDEALQGELERAASLYGFNAETILPMAFSGACRHCTKASTPRHATT